MRQCGNVGRRALRCGAPAVTPGGSAQADNAECPMPNASRSVCHIVKLEHHRNCGYHRPFRVIHCPYRAFIDQADGFFIV